LLSLMGGSIGQCEKWGILYVSGLLFFIVTVFSTRSSIFVVVDGRFDWAVRKMGNSFFSFRSTLLINAHLNVVTVH